MPFPKARITNSEQAAEMGRKGGLSRSLAKKMINRQFCTSTCPMFSNCWAKHTAHSLYETVVKKAEEDGWSEKSINSLKPECALKNLPTQVIEGSKRIILDGEAGFNNEMMEQVMRLKNDLLISNMSPRDRERYLFQLRETKKSIYGDKSRIESDLKGVLTAEDFAVAYDDHKKAQAIEAKDKKAGVDKHG